MRGQRETGRPWVSLTLRPQASFPIPTVTGQSCRRLQGLDKLSPTQGLNSEQSLEYSIEKNSGDRSQRHLGDVRSG